MKAEEYAWRDLRNHAAAQLHRDFANRVMRAAHGPQAEVWQQMQAQAARRLRPGFAERVLRAARQLPGAPSILDQFAFSAATAAVCILAAVFIHQHKAQLEDERNLATWQNLVSQVGESDTIAMR